MKPATPRRAVLCLGAMVCIGAVIAMLVMSCAASTTPPPSAGTPTASAPAPSAQSAVKTTVVLVLGATQRAASTQAFETPAKAAAWKTIPSWYFISSGHRIITATSEQAMAERAHSHVTVFDGGSHLTLISHPDAVTAVIDEAIASVQ